MKSLLHNEMCSALQMASKVLVKLGVPTPWNWHEENCCEAHDVGAVTSTAIHNVSRVEAVATLGPNCKSSRRSQTRDTQRARTVPTCWFGGVSLTEVITSNKISRLVNRCTFNSAKRRILNFFKIADHTPYIASDTFAASVGYLTSSCIG